MPSLKQQMLLVVSHLLMSAHQLPHTVTQLWGADTYHWAWSTLGESRLCIPFCRTDVGLAETTCSSQVFQRFSFPSFSSFLGRQPWEAHCLSSLPTAQGNEKLKKMLESFRAISNPLQNHPFGMAFKLPSGHLQPIVWVKCSGCHTSVDSHPWHSLKWLFLVNQGLLPL